MRPLRTNAGPAVTASRAHCRPGCGVQCFAGRLRGASRRDLPLGQDQKLGETSLRLVELGVLRERVKHLWGGTADDAAFEFGVVLHAHPDQDGVKRSRATPN